MLEIPQYVIEDLGTIWRTLTSGLSIDSIKLGNFCDSFVKKFLKDKSVNFYLFSPTIHKILFHGKGGHSQTIWTILLILPHTNEVYFTQELYMIE